MMRPRIGLHHCPDRTAPIRARPDLSAKTINSGIEEIISMTKNILNDEISTEAETSQVRAVEVSPTDNAGMSAVDERSSGWADKYKPQKIEDLILPEECRQRVEAWATAEKLPHILIVGQGGIGKTCLIEALIKAKKFSRLYYNGGTKRGIDLVREIKNASSSLTVFGEYKAIFIDEFDGLTQEAYSGLRGDTMSSNVSVFMATANDLKKVPSPVRNRFHILDLDKAIAKDRGRLLDLHVRRAMWILEREAVTFDHSAVESLVRQHFPSARGWMEDLQAYSAGGTLKLPDSPLPPLATGAPALVPESGDVPSEPVSLVTSKPSKTSALLDDIENFITQFVVVKPESIRAMALFVLHTHAHDAASHSPLLWLSSAEKRCGKSTTLKPLGRLVPNPILTSNMSVPGMLRAIESIRPTFLIDEMEHALKATSGLHGILNLGHSPDGVMVRADATYSTWAPKVLALIGELPDTLEDRSIRIALRRRLPSEKVERFGPVHEKIAVTLRKRCETWINAATLKALRDADPALPVSLDDRAQDNWRPLIAIADHAGGGWAEKARQAAEAISSRETISEPSPGLLILEAARNWFDGKSDDHIPSVVLGDLARQVGAVKGTPRSRMIRVARILSRLDISRDTFRAGAATEKGYHRTDLENAFERYLTGEAVD
jgi:DNA polymerase III delta prime subunit